MLRRISVFFVIFAIGQSVTAFAAKVDTKPYEERLYARCKQQLPEEKRNSEESKRECRYSAIMTISGHEELFRQAYKKPITRECRKKSENVGQCVLDAKREYMDEVFMPGGSR